MQVSRSSLLLALSLIISSTAFASSFENMYKTLTSHEEKEIYIYHPYQGNISKLERVEFVKLLDKETDFTEQTVKVLVKRKDSSRLKVRNVCWGTNDCSEGSDLAFTILDKFDSPRLISRNSVYYWKKKSRVKSTEGVIACDHETEIYSVKGKLLTTKAGGADPTLLIEDSKGNRYALSENDLSDSLGLYDSYCHFMTQEEYIHQQKKNYKVGDKIKFNEIKSKLFGDGEYKKVRTGIIRNISGLQVTVDGGMFDGALMHTLYLDQIIEENPLYPLSPSDYPGALTIH